MRHIYLLLLVSICSCTTIYFEESQPKETAHLASFPEDIQGGYLAQQEGEEDTIYIRATSILFPEESEKNIPISDVDAYEGIQLKGDWVFDASLPEEDSIRFTIRGDTIHYKVRYYISKQLSDSMVLKRHGKMLVLSEKVEDSKYWNVYLIEPIRKGGLKLLTIGHFQTENNHEDKLKYDGELKDFYSITDFIKVEDTKYLLNPTGKQFKKLVRKGLFVELMRYKRIEVGEVEEPERF